uniref:Uncharacterized protein n=1 Tax=Brassica oleracea TaxID=3712 RepID=A0A3P6G7D6_BRAOL|nr:unnamed protein product [Brassica oleracea]
MDVFDGLPDPILVDILDKVGDVKNLASLQFPLKAILLAHPSVRVTRPPSRPCCYHRVATRFSSQQLL